mmetsp:Transcript_58792/g.167152  ORF Transcript_58792/g.167152 Transcript_58792/m.167152 type:complete len:247 (+) Transcript_58792:1138-1878(+)
MSRYARCDLMMYSSWPSWFSKAAAASSLLTHTGSGQTASVLMSGMARPPAREASETTSSSHWSARTGMQHLSAGRHAPASAPTAGAPSEESSFAATKTMSVAINTRTPKRKKWSPGFCQTTSSPASFSGSQRKSLKTRCPWNRRSITPQPWLSSAQDARPSSRRRSPSQAQATESANSRAPKTTQDISFLEAPMAKVQPDIERARPWTTGKAMLLKACAPDGRCSRETPRCSSGALSFPRTVGRCS